MQDKGIKGIPPRTTRTVKSARDAGPQVQAPMRFMPCLKATFAPFHASCSVVSPFERVNCRRAARHSRRRAAYWLFHQYIEPLADLRSRRGIEYSQAATTFCLAERTVSTKAQQARPNQAHQ